MIKCIRVPTGVCVPVFDGTNAVDVADFLGRLHRTQVELASSISVEEGMLYMGYRLSGRPPPEIQWINDIEGLFARLFDGSEQPWSVPGDWWSERSRM